MSAVSDAHHSSSDAHEKMNSHHGGKGTRHLLADRSTMGHHEANGAKKAARRSHWADWIASTFERGQAVRDAAHEHVSDSVGRFHGGKKHGGKHWNK